MVLVWYQYRWYILQCKISKKGEWLISVVTVSTVLSVCTAKLVCTGTDGFVSEWYDTNGTIILRFFESMII